MRDYLAAHPFYRENCPSLPSRSALTAQMTR